MAIVLAAGRATPATVRSTAAPTTVAAVSGPLVNGSDAKFQFLAQQRSTELMGMPSSMRLQGSCCFPMDLGRYRAQIKGLKPYAGVAQIPRDPYDIPVSLAKRLLAYRATIRLSGTQAREYRQAMRMTPLKGPCCCHCWRWEAFGGMSEYLIAQRHWAPGRIAQVITLENGCGGVGA